MTLSSTDKTNLNALTPNLAPNQVALSALRLTVFQEIYTYLDSIINDLNNAQAAGSVTSSKLADGSVITIKIADNNVTSTKIADSAIVTLKLADGAVTSIKLGDLQVTSAKLADACVTSAKIADGNVTTAKIADGAVTPSKIPDGSINTQKLPDGAVTTSKLTSSAVTRDKIASGAVGSGQLDPTLLTNYGDIAVQAKFAELTGLTGVSLEAFPIQAPETNDTERLNRAIASLNTGDVLVIPNKTYIIDPITISNKTSIKIIGNGTFKRNAELTATEIGLINIIGCTNIYLQGFTLDNNNFGGAGIYISDSPYFEVDRIKVKNMNDISVTSSVFGIRVQGGNSYGSIRNSYFDQINGANVSRGVIVSNFGVTSNQTIGIEVRNCRFSNMSGGPDNDAVVIDQRGFAGYHRILDNQFIDISKRAIKVNGSSCLTARNKAVKNNTGVGYAVISSYGNDNIVEDNEGYGFGSGGWTAGVDTLGSTIIRRNKFINSPTASNSSSDGVSIDLDASLGSPCDSVVIEENHFENIRYGTRLRANVPINKLSINKNRYKGTITGHIQYLQSTCNNLAIEGNMSDTSPNNFLAFDVLPTTPITLINNHHNASFGLCGSRIATMTARTNIFNTTPDFDIEHGMKILYQSSMPASGSFVIGDKVINTNPSVLGAASSKYIITSWRRITTGSGNVLNTDWVEEHVLTGQ